MCILPKISAERKLIAHPWAACIGPWVPIRGAEIAAWRRKPDPSGPDTVPTARRSAA